MYYFNRIWLYNYGMMVHDVMQYGGVVNFAKGVWRYRWVGQTYLTVMHWFDRGFEGMRGPTLARLRLALPGHGQRDDTAVHAHVLRGRQPTRRQAQRALVQDPGARRDRRGRHLLPLARQDGRRAAADGAVLRHLPRQLPHRAQLHRRRPVHRPARRPLPDVPGRGRTLHPRRHAGLLPVPRHLERGLRRLRRHEHTPGLGLRQTALRHASAHAVRRPAGAGALPPRDRGVLEVHRGADGHAVRLRRAS